MDTVHDLAGWLGRLGLVAIVLALPLFYGGVLPVPLEWAALALTGVVFLAAISWVTTPRFLASSKSAVRLILFGLPLILGMGYGALQTLPLSPKSLEILSPHVGELAAELLPAPGSEEARIEGEMLATAVPPLPRGLFPNTMSISPRETREELTLLVMAASGFFAAGLLFGTPKERRFLWGTIAVAGGIFALMAMLGRSSPELSWRKQFWPAAGYGTFVNRNNAAGWLVLTLGPALAMAVRSILVQVRCLDEAEELYAGKYRAVQQSGFWQRTMDNFYRMIDSFSGTLFFWLVVASLIFAGGCVSLSRGGTLGMMLALMVGGGVFAARRGGGRYAILFGGVLVAAIFLIGWIGMQEPVTARLATLWDRGDGESDWVPPETSRPENWRAALSTATAWHGRGSGLGTYATANRAADISLRGNTIFVHAENQLVETAVVAGIPGVVLLLTQILIFLVAAFRSCRTRVEPEERFSDEGGGDRGGEDRFAFALGVLVILAGLAVTGSFDFGLFLPANMMLAAVLFGSFAGKRDDIPSQSFGKTRGWFGIWGLFFALLGLTAAGWWGYSQRQVWNRVTPILASAMLDEEKNRIHPVFFQIPREYRPSRGVPLESEIPSLSFIDGIITELERARDLDFWDTRIHSRLADFHQFRYRLVMLESLKKSGVPGGIERLWMQTSPEIIHWELALLERTGMMVGPRKFRAEPVVQEHLVPAMREVLISRRIDPLASDPYILFGLLLPLTAETSARAEILSATVRRIEQVATNEPDVLFRTGVLCFLGGNTPEACRSWRESLTLSPKNLGSVLELLTSTGKPASRGENIAAALPDDLAVLERALRIYAKSSPQVRDVVLEKMEKMVEGVVEKDSGEFYRLRARWNLLSDRPEEACRDYEEAIARSRRQASYYYEYGTLLLARKEAPRAVELLEKAVLFAPERVEYRRGLIAAQKLRTELILNPPDLKNLNPWQNRP